MTMGKTTHSFTGVKKSRPLKVCFTDCGVMSVNYCIVLFLKDSVLKKHKLARELSDLVNYCVSTRFIDFQNSLQKRKYGWIFLSQLFLS